MSEKKGLIVIPFRNRHSDIAVTIPAIKKLTNCDVLVIEQVDDGLFNRGKLANCAVLLSPDYDYYVVHDSDMNPISADYSYSVNPTHLAAQASQFDYKLPYPAYFGGVTIFPEVLFRMVNGFSNMFHFYACEDDLIHDELIKLGCKLESRLCRFESLPHPKADTQSEQVQKNRALLQYYRRNGRPKSDGLSNTKYEVVYREFNDTHTVIGVNLL